MIFMVLMSFQSGDFFFIFKKYISFSSLQKTVMGHNLEMVTLFLAIILADLQSHKIVHISLFEVFKKQTCIKCHHFYFYFTMHM